MLRGSTGVPNSEANTSPWSCHWSPQQIAQWLRQEFREEVAMQALVIATIPSVAAVLTAALGFRDLGMRRKLETSKQFLALFATAHGRPVDERDHVGIGEQVASICLIADFAASEKLLRNTAREGLKDLLAWEGSANHDKVAHAAKTALHRLN
jgi:hypothetical protein